MPQAQLTVDPQFAVGTVNRRLFGSFVEHLGLRRDLRASHPLSDNDRFRTDVLELVGGLGGVDDRYPGDSWSRRSIMRSFNVESVFRSSASVAHS